MGFRAVFLRSVLVLAGVVALTLLVGDRFGPAVQAGLVFATIVCTLGVIYQAVSRGRGPLDGDMD